MADDEDVDASTTCFPSTTLFLLFVEEEVDEVLLLQLDEAAAAVGFFLYTLCLAFFSFPMIVNGNW